jgi:tetratricopeptide (TPR) repeat protein
VRPTPGAPYNEAITHFARGLGAARGGKPADAAVEIERLAAIHARMVEMKDAYWAEQVDIQRRVVEAWKVYAEGDKAKGVSLLSAVADAEDLTDKAAVTPGPIAPARELLGFMLLDAGRAAEALAAFEANLEKEPNRFRGLYGAGQAAEAAGDRVKAARFYQQLVQMVPGDASSQRPELQHARTFVGRKG